MKRLLTILLFVLAQTAFSQVPATPSASPEPSPTPARSVQKFTPPPFQNLRYDEDYGYLRDETKRGGYFDKLKFIPLNEKKDWYLSLGGEARTRYETYRNASFGAGVQDANGYYLNRFMLHADFHFGKKFRFFGQLKSGLENDRRGGARPFDEDKLDVNQAFIDVTPIQKENFSLSVRAGRQEAEFGSSRLVSAREGLNVRQPFDGVRIISKIGKWQIAPFFLKPVQTRRGFFDDSTNGEQIFFGGYVVRNLPKLNGIVVGYFGDFDRKQNRFDQGAGREQRQLLGTRFAGNRKNFDFNYEALAQWGKFAAADIRAWAIITDNGYSFPKIRFKPRLALRFDATSGDKNPADDKLETFNALFNAGNAYSGLIGLVGSSNSTGLIPSVNLSFPKRFFVRADYGFFWRTSRRDAVYGLAGGVLRSGQLSRAKFVGHQPSLSIEWRANRHLSFTALYGHFFTGKFLRETPPAQDVDYFTTFMTFRF